MMGFWLYVWGGVLLGGRNGDPAEIIEIQKRGQGTDC